MIEFLVHVVTVEIRGLPELRNNDPEQRVAVIVSHRALVPEPAEVLSSLAFARLISTIAVRWQTLFSSHFVFNR